MAKMARQLELEAVTGADPGLLQRNFELLRDAYLNIHNDINTKEWVYFTSGGKKWRAGSDPDGDNFLIQYLTSGDWKVQGNWISMLALSKDGALYLPETTAPAAISGYAALWNDSTQKALQTFVSGIEQTLTGCIFTQTADQTIADTTDETSLFGTGVGTLILPANFWTVGKTIRVEIHGDFADMGNPTVDIHAYYGATKIIDSSPIALSGLGGTEEWETEVVITCRSVGATGTVETIIDWEYETTTGSSAIERLDVSGTLTTIDTTASGALDVTFQWGTAAAANTLTSEVGFVEVLN